MGDLDGEEQARAREKVYYDTRDRTSHSVRHVDQNKAEKVQIERPEKEREANQHLDTSGKSKPYFISVIAITLNIIYDGKEK